MTRRSPFLIVAIFVIVGCVKTPKPYTSNQVMDEFSPSEFEFEYLQAKGRIVLEEPSGKVTKGTINLRAKKDSALWFSITPGLGLEAIRGLLTADKIQIRDRMNGEDLNMSFTEINDLHGLGLSFDLIQNMVYANIPDDYSYQDRLVRIGRYFELTQERSGFKMHSRVSTSIAKVIELRSENEDKGGKIDFTYPMFEDVQGQPFPSKLLMKLAITDKEDVQKTTLHIEFNKIETSSSPISFPFNY